MPPKRGSKRARTTEALQSTAAAHAQQLLAQDGKAYIVQWLDDHPEHVQTVVGWIRSGLWDNTTDSKGGSELTFSKSYTRMYNLSKSMLLDLLCTWQPDLCAEALGAIMKVCPESILHLFCVAVGCDSNSKLFSRKVDEFNLIAEARYHAFGQRCQSLVQHLGPTVTNMPWEEWGYFKPARKGKFGWDYSLGNAPWTHLVHLDGRAAPLPDNVVFTCKWRVECNHDEKNAKFVPPDGGLLQLPCLAMFKDLPRPSQETIEQYIQRLKGSRARQAGCSPQARSEEIGSHALMAPIQPLPALQVPGFVSFGGSSGSLMPPPPPPPPGACSLKAKFEIQNPKLEMAAGAKEQNNPGQEDDKKEEEEEEEEEEENADKNEKEKDNAAPEIAQEIGPPQSH